ncbi:putative hypothtetical protein, conserved [Neospora caninum Liverpool]|uniref:Putative hypothtetical protein, conserved n=1 Tax=Neospora caninum (strain Liverpool) TaxID=572307 RepID=F0VK77_NEOCL|nr:putative hypothtetical protein, conserved [Neospora caninum Liverpool]CBZ54478.1 putative hypothtetical protein, conserved [Neospora caninum Liverpool]|eukprot:XP_003884508.1 putative hypothtetical protein, conserved [Neospora caninum Liverpool]
MAINATRHTAGDGRNMEGICPLSPLDDVGLEIATESGSLANHAAAAALWEQPHSPVHPDVAVPEAFIAANTSSDGTSVGQRAESEFLAACLVPSGAEAQSAAGVYSLERLHAEVGFEDASDEKRETRLVSQAGKESSGQLKGGASKDESRSTREEKTVLECDADSGDDFVESEGAIDIEKIPEGHILRRMKPVLLPDQDGVGGFAVKPSNMKSMGLLMEDPEGNEVPVPYRRFTKADVLHEIQNLGKDSDWAEHKAVLRVCPLEELLVVQDPDGMYGRSFAWVFTEIAYSVMAKNNNFVGLRKELDLGIQAISTTAESETQTYHCIPTNSCTQYSNEDIWTKGSFNDQENKAFANFFSRVGMLSDSLISYACMENATFEERIERSGRAAQAHILVWHFEEIIMPQAVFSAPSLALWKTEGLTEPAGKSVTDTHRMQQQKQPRKPIVTSSIDFSHKRTVSDIRVLPPGTDFRKNLRPVFNPSNTSTYLITSSGDGNIMLWDVSAAVHSAHLDNFQWRPFLQAPLKKAESEWKDKTQKSPAYELSHRSQPVHERHVDGLAITLSDCMIMMRSKGLQNLEQRQPATSRSVCQEDGEVLFGDWAQPGEERKIDYIKTLLAIKRPVRLRRMEPDTAFSALSRQNRWQPRGLGPL